MQYQILEHPAFLVAGPEIRTTSEENAEGRSIANFWIRLMQSGEFERLMAVGVAEHFAPGTTFGVSVPDGTPEGSFLYQVGVEVSDAGLVEFGSRSIPASTWAVFEAVGDPSDAIPPMFEKVHSEFFPQEPWQQVPGVPDLEVYPPGEMGPHYVTQIWFPVRPRAV